jgi:hypothetical protein
MQWGRKTDNRKQKGERGGGEKGYIMGSMCRVKGNYSYYNLIMVVIQV